MTRSNVGLAIKAAIERGEHYRRLCPRRLTVRIMCRWGDYANVVHIPWEELDSRAHKLVAIVDQCVAEVETQFGLRRLAA